MVGPRPSRRIHPKGGSVRGGWHLRPPGQTHPVTDRRYTFQTPLLQVNPPPKATRMMVSPALILPAFQS